jgi:hypothetical protein
LGGYRAARIENFYVQLGNTGFNAVFTLHECIRMTNESK